MGYPEGRLRPGRCPGEPGVAGEKGPTIIAFLLTFREVPYYNIFNPEFPRKGSPVPGKIFRYNKAR